MNTEKNNFVEEFEKIKTIIKEKDLFALVYYDDVIGSHSFTEKVFENFADTDEKLAWFDFNNFSENQKDELSDLISEEFYKNEIENHDDYQDYLTAIYGN